jgi:hypothetical protein
VKSVANRPSSPQDEADSRSSWLSFANCQLRESKDDAPVRNESRALAESLVNGLLRPRAWNVCQGSTQGSFISRPRLC